MDKCPVLFCFRPRRKLRVVVNVALFVTFLFCVDFVRRQRPSTFVSETAEEVLLPLPKTPYSVPDLDPSREGHGEGGRGVTLTGRDAEVSQQQVAGSPFMSVIISDMLSFDRTLKDQRSSECRRLVYDPHQLQTASVVVVFTDEPFSSLVRTVHSIVNRSPRTLLKEVVLVDDFSTHEELGVRLARHVSRFGGLVRLIRSNKRLGLIRARLTGAKAARGEVLVFIDAHCEATDGWLEPLLDRIRESRTAVVCPVIDGISATTLRYEGGSAGGVGGFWWSLHYKMESIPESERERRKNPATDYLRTPTMAGGLFAVHREYFFEVGAYDEGMEIWGGENLEISFRVWMCGGSIEILPCSHVGHIFRAGHPYNMTSMDGNPDVHGFNSKRLADVWMDDYKRLFYYHRNSLKNSFAGDVSERVALRQQLKCQSFKWYLDNIAPHMFVPDEHVKAFGFVRNIGNGLCLDNLQRNENKETVNLGIFGCQGGNSEGQMFSFSTLNELRREVTCVDVGGPSDRPGNSVAVLAMCKADQPIEYEYEVGFVTSSDSHMTFLVQDAQLRHVRTGLCLDATNITSGLDVFFSPCDLSKTGQKWKFERNYMEAT